MDADEELQGLRAQRMAQMQEVGGAGKQGHGATGDQQRAAREETANREELMKNSILSQVLDQDARARLSTISAAKPEKGQKLEQMIIQLARSGQIRGKMNDEQLKSLLDQISDHVQSKTTTVKFDRRRAALDSDED